MGRKIDFDDWENKYSSDVKRIIKEAAEFILGDGSMTMRQASKELGIPRTTLRRYMREYLLYLSAMGCPEYNEHGEEIDFDDLYVQLRVRAKENKYNYSTPGCGHWTHYKRYALGRRR